MSTTRRRFIAASSLAAAAASLPRIARAGQPATSPKPGSEPDPISADTIAAAEQLAGIEFTPTKREMLAKSIAPQIDRFKRRQSIPLPANDVAPALTFDPRLPGMKFDLEQRPLTRSAILGPLPPVPDQADDIAYAPVTTLSRWIEARKLTSRRLTDIYLQRLHRLDDKLKFAITITDDLAHKQADAADAEIAAGKYRGPLHGIPWGAKDLLDTADIPTTWGAEPYKDRLPKRDAAVVRKLSDAGAVLVAKTTLGALAMGDVWHGGRTNNPWNPERGSSGSSAGSAAAVASGCIGFGIGTETLGSIISPSRTCGSTGLRPTFGRVSRAGAMALCWSLDKLGPMARCAEDCALVLAAINGVPRVTGSADTRAEHPAPSTIPSSAGDPDDPSHVNIPFNFDATKPIKGLRIGHTPAAFKRQGVHPAHAQTLETLRTLGCELVELDLPQWPFDVLLNILECEAAAAFEELTRTGRDDLLKSQGPDAWPNNFREAWFIPGIEVIQAQRFRRQCMKMMMEKFEHFDAILDPTNNAGPLCMITNNTGHPSLTIRIGFNDNGLPVGTTLIGRLFDEGTMIRLGMDLEKQLGVWDKRPGV
jgi:Asp-tRNA(Asn)/Glu-tRNA(Gln) amidotransferase A subunit family amidase